jgi:uncharacterized protein with HEPN domain
LQYGRIAAEIARDGPARAERDPVRRLALERALYIVGEAAGALSDEAKRQMDQPWGQIAGLRVLLAHHYEVVEPRILVDIAKSSAPDLIATIEAYLATHPP